MTDNGELHVVFGTGAVGMAVMDDLVQRGPRPEAQVVALGQPAPNPRKVLGVRKHHK
jgi:hypothetical protein